MLTKNNYRFENIVYVYNINAYFDKVIDAKCTFINIVICFVQQYMMKQVIVNNV